MRAALVLLLIACDGAPSTPDGAVTGCDSDEQCSDGRFCNGEETCTEAGCAEGTPPCPAARCVETSRSCTTTCDPADGDGDGHDDVVCGGDDCDDTDADRAPGMTELCDLDDEDCDPDTFGERDADDDGYLDSACCDGDRCGDDCDDSDPGVHPSEAEACDAIDNDCDHLVDEDVTSMPFYPDCDRDLFGAAGAPATMACTAPTVPPPCDGAAGARWAANDDDCYDGLAAIRPDAIESCNGADDDCDGTIDDAATCAPGEGVASAVCDSGVCAIEACDIGRADCDLIAVNGCEIDLSSSALHCGTCGDACVVEHGVGRCAMHACSIGACDSGYHACEGSCVRSDDPATCGSRCEPCPLPEGASRATCDGSSCGVECASGRHRCGAECRVDDSPMSCGARCTPCPSIAFGSATCAGGVCGLACDDGRALSGAACIAAARPIAPLAGSIMSGRRPTFRWELAPGYDGVRIELCSDASCSTVITSFDATGTSFTPSTTLGTGTMFWRLRARNGASVSAPVDRPWVFWIPRTGSSRAAVCGFGLDLDADGYFDVPRNAGGVAFHRGRSIGVEQSPSTRAPISSGFGDPFALGDVDGDGLGDVWIAGHLVRGATPTIATRVTPTSWNLRSVVAAGDVDGDGYGDIAVFYEPPDYFAAGRSLAILYGGPAPFTREPTDLALPYPYADSSRLVGTDADGDGYSDLIVAQMWSESAVDSFSGAYVFPGRPGGPLSASSFSFNYGDHRFDYIARAGDVDADGYCDLIAGHGIYDGGHRLLRYSFGVHRGGAGFFADTPFATIATTVSYSNATGVDDLSGDGRSEIILSTSTQSALYLGTSGTFATAMMLSGARMLGLADTNGDGLGDVFAQTGSSLFMGRSSPPGVGAPIVLGD
jgi:hypothetical protein